MVQDQIAEIFRTDSRRILATLIRLVKDFDLAEEAMQEAFAAALDRWPREGVPINPSAWLISTGKFKAIDAVRRRVRRDAALPELAARADRQIAELSEVDDSAVPDDQLRLIFTCCHPALSEEARVALTLREVCGLTTEEIARAFLKPTPTVAQRIVRAKAKIRDAGIPYQVPSAEDLPDRLETVLMVIYLVFTEGYAATSGDQVTRADLADEAIRLARLVIDLLPEPEVRGLLALMLLQDSRRHARTAPNGDLILLADQDRSLWDREKIAEGRLLLQQVFTSRRIGPYSVQAAIAAVHADATTADATDWGQIVSLYDVLFAIEPSPVVQLNRAVAVAMRDGAEEGIREVDVLLEDGHFKDSPIPHTVRAELLQRAGRAIEARQAYETALPLIQQAPERRYVEAKLAELAGSPR